MNNFLDQILQVLQQQHQTYQGMPNHMDLNRYTANMAQPDPNINYTMQNYQPDQTMQTMGNNIYYNRPKPGSI